MSVPAHPENDLLADLAADVLPIDVARQVEAHVMGCARCSEVLSSAEGIRGLLRQAPPESMPPQVMARLEQAMSLARNGQAPQQPQQHTGPQRTGPLRRDARGGGTGPQQQQSHQQQPQSRQQPQRQHGAGQQHGTGPQRQHTGPQPTRHPQEQPLRPAATGQGPQNTPGTQGNQPAPNTSSSYTVRPLKRTGGDEQFPAGDATVLQPAVRDDHDPELTQPVRKRRTVRSAAPGPNTGSMTTQMRPVRDRAPGKLTRMDSTQAVRVRRQALEEQKADEPSRWPTISPKIAAAVVFVMALAGGGGVAWKVLGGQSDEGSGGGASTSASAPLVASVQESGTKYRRQGLDQQISSLVTTPASASADTKAGEAAEDEESGTFSAQSQGEDEGNTAAASGGDLLKDPEALSQCLEAIDQKDAQPVAVDLASYNGQEAALIVLPGTSGGYQVWIVARTCQPGDDGTIDVIDVNS
ncbi:cupin domain-containing protein [Kineosporia succinea]|uniref:Zinc finger protein n=1 Tax=Kineosporia succinea TaxID=84632 RepID=A0ABT9P131_9ACTN|nr:hypothetical protein [Kineosporia succinea]MDP9826391.1 hypothetical protein [Kineosporia succinea]